MYLHQALKAHNREEFLKAMSDEIGAHMKNKNWVLMHRDSVPAGKSILPAVWAIRRKRNIATRQVYKWKARLDIHSGKQIYGQDPSGFVANNSTGNVTCCFT
jgi:hypothetical protein